MQVHSDVAPSTPAHPIFLINSHEGIWKADIGEKEVVTATCIEMLHDAGRQAAAWNCEALIPPRSGLHALM